MWNYVSSVLGGLGSGLSAQQAAEQQKFQLSMSAQQHKYNSQTATINAQLAASTNYYNQLVAEKAATAQNLADGAAMASTITSQAGSGIFMNSASSYEVRANEKLMHKANLVNAETNRINELAAGNALVTNYMTTALTERAAGEADTIIASSIDPRKAFWMSAAITGLSSYAGQMAGQAAFQSSVDEMLSSVPGGVK